MALKVMLAPHRYVQGPNALLELGEQLQVIGIQKPLILASPSARKAVESLISQGLGSKNIEAVFTEFRGECTWKEIERVKNLCIEGGHDAIISCGGGKTLDTGRAAASRSATVVDKVPSEFIPDIGAGVACINIPTVAATDATTSCGSLVYTKDGIVEAILAVPTNPTVVFVDTAVIAKAPVRFLVAGMGDALVTYFEADASRRTATPSLNTGHLSTRAAQALARLCLDILLGYGVQAKLEAEAGVPGPGIEAVVEANVLLSGLGFESCGLGAGHAVGLAFYHIADHFEVFQYHGEVVGFGALTQLIMEEREPEYLNTIFGFCRAVGLPTTFEELTLRNVTDEVLQTVADAASRDVEIRSMPGARAVPDEEGRFYDPIEILLALKATDAYGREFAHRSCFEK
jgi:glycerol dehydrogenase